ncbi:MAG: hypothetical protein IJ874_04830 [Ruminococcus sp.]|nr:hypothetical protein [Ruminococcus sp.]
MRYPCCFLLCAGLCCTILPGCSAGSSSVQSSSSESGLPAEALQAVTDYFDGYNTADPLKVVQSYTPAAFLEAEKNSGSYDEYIAETAATIAEAVHYWEDVYGDGARVQLDEVVSASQLTQDSFQDIERYIKLDFFSEDYEISVVQGYEADIVYSVSGSELTESEEVGVCLVEIENDGWKMIFDSLSGVRSYLEEYDTYYDEPQ